MGKILRFLLGLVFMLLALLGGLLPILQGWIFFALAVLCWSIDIPFFRKAVIYVKKKAPHTRKPLKKWRNWLKNKTDGDGKS